jgi:hypothetical protein
MDCARKYDWTQQSHCLEDGYYKESKNLISDNVFLLVELLRQSSPNDCAPFMTVCHDSIAPKISASKPNVSFYKADVCGIQSGKYAVMLYGDFLDIRVLVEFILLCELTIDEQRRNETDVRICCR